MSDILPPAVTHGKHSKAILYGSLAAGAVLLYLFMHRSAAGQVAPAAPADTGTGAPVDDTPVSGSTPEYGSDGGGYSYGSDGSSGAETEPPLTIGTTSVAPGPTAAKHKPHPTTVHHKAQGHKEVSHPAQVHTNPVHQSNVKHHSEVMNSHHGGTNPSAHTEHHPAPAPASNHHHPRGKK